MTEPEKALGGRIIAGLRCRDAATAIETVSDRRALLNSSSCREGLLQKGATELQTGRVDAVAEPLGHVPFHG